MSRRAYAWAMRIFAIVDTHLSRAKPKPIDIFGAHWHKHDERIRERWNSIAQEDDVLLVAGGISWAMKLEEARPDLEFLATFKGEKLLLKGNHDFWWDSVSKRRAQAPAGISF